MEFHKIKLNDSAISTYQCVFINSFCRDDGDGARWNILKWQIKHCQNEITGL